MPPETVSAALDGQASTAPLDVHVYDIERPWCLFVADAYEGGLSWEHPSSSTLGDATLFGRAVMRDSDGREVIRDVSYATLRSYLAPWPGESELNFRRRKGLAVYINLTAPIVDAYVDSVTGRVSREYGALDPYLVALDGESQRWPELVTDVVRQAALDGVCACVIDAPSDAPAVASRAEEQARGIGLRACVVPMASWAWVKLDRRGCLEEFAYADAPVSDTTALNQRLRVWVWNASGWACYEWSAPRGVELGNARATILKGTPVASGQLAAGLGGKLPVVFCYNRRQRRTRAPRGISIASGPSTVGRQVYQLLSNIEDTQRRAPPFLAVPTAAKGGLEPETAAKVGPDNSFPVPADASGQPTWVTFPPASLADMRQHVAFLVGLAFRSAGLEVQADQSAQVQSGEALRLRSRDFEARARKLALDAADFERRAFAVASAYLGFAPDEARATYPQRYVVADPSELLAAALTVLDKIGAKLGVEGTLTATRQALDAALSLDDEQLDAILEEVRAKLEAPKPKPPVPPQGMTPAAGETSTDGKPPEAPVVDAAEAPDPMSESEA
jgi:hypothetical protein